MFLCAKTPPHFLWCFCPPSIYIKISFPPEPCFCLLHTCQIEFKRHQPDSMFLCFERSINILYYSVHLLYIKITLRTTQVVSIFAGSKLESMEMKLYERILLIMSSKEQEGYGCGFLALLKMFEIGYQDFGWNFISICSKGQTAVVCLLPSGFCPKCLILNFEWALSSFFSKECRTCPCFLLPGSAQNAQNKYFNSPMKPPLSLRVHAIHLVL